MLLVVVVTVAVKLVWFGAWREGLLRAAIIALLRRRVVAGSRVTVTDLVGRGDPVAAVVRLALGGLDEPVHEVDLARDREVFEHGEQMVERLLELWASTRDGPLRGVSAVGRRRDVCCA